MATRSTPAGKVPDWPARLAGVKLLLAYRDGMPIQRKEEVTRRETTDAEVVARLATKRGYRQAVRNYIDALERQEEEKLRDLGAREAE